jgi:hypothetical protein
LCRKAGLVELSGMEGYVHSCLQSSSRQREEELELEARIHYTVSFPNPKDGLEYRNPFLN